MNPTTMTNLKDNKGARLWQEAKQIIPGGNQLLSKRAEMFLPDNWPAYYDRARGCEIWDLAGKHYYDFLQMGVGACVLGYADADVEKAVINAIQKGSMSTLNCWEEVQLAKEMIALHPWAQMARFSRAGGEACSIAVRIARAATGKEKIAFCGYHGWHDWYLSSNIVDKTNLDAQLLSGLEPKGVVNALKSTAIPFQYNALDQLEKIVTQNHDQIGTIIMEVVRSTEPNPGFLEGVKKIAQKIGAVLIFDEITSGFRMNVGGIHLKYQIEPDMAVFGKALGNGYPISAIIGKKKYMNAAQESFISSTFWTERVGYAAALAVLEKMKTQPVHHNILEYRSKLIKGFEHIALVTGVPIKTGGSTLMYVSIAHPQSAALMTYYTQEMLKRGFLAGSSICCTFAFTNELIDRFLAQAQEIFHQIGQWIKTNTDVTPFLEGPIKHSGFKRLTD